MVVGGFWLREACRLRLGSFGFLFLDARHNWEISCLRQGQMHNGLSEFFLDPIAATWQRDLKFPADLVLAQREMEKRRSPLV